MSPRALGSKAPPFAWGCGIVRQRLQWGAPDTMQPHGSGKSQPSFELAAAGPQAGADPVQSLPRLGGGGSGGTVVDLANAGGSLFRLRFGRRDRPERRDTAHARLCFAAAGRSASDRNQRRLSRGLHEPGVRNALCDPSTVRIRRFSGILSDVPEEFGRAGAAVRFGHVPGSMGCTGERGSNMEMSRMRQEIRVTRPGYRRRRP